jgi:hypothetical protein
VAVNSRRSQFSAQQAVTTSPYHQLSDLLRRLRQLSTKSRHDNTSYFGKLKRLRNDWDAADALARKTSASRGIPFAAFDPAISEAKTLVIELAQVAVGDVAVHFDPTDSRYAKAERRLEELGETYAGATGGSVPRMEPKPMNPPGSVALSGSAQPILSFLDPDHQPATPTVAGLTGELDALFDEAAAEQRQRDEDTRAARERARRLQEYMDLREQLATALDRAYRFPNEENERGSKPSPEGFRFWAERFVVVGEVMRQCDAEIESLGLISRLKRVAATDAPLSMKFACALLAEASSGNAEEMVSLLERSNGDQVLRRFVGWLPFVLDNLWHPYRASGSFAVSVAQAPPEATLEEARQASAAFGWRAIPIMDEPPDPRNVRTTAEVRSPADPGSETDPAPPPQARLDGEEDGGGQTDEDRVRAYLDQHGPFRLEAAKQWTDRAMQATGLTRLRLQRTEAWKAHENAMLTEWLRTRPGATDRDVMQVFGFRKTKANGMAAFQEHLKRKAQTHVREAVQHPDGELENHMDAAVASPLEQMENRETIVQYIIEYAPAKMRGAIHRLSSSERDALASHVANTCTPSLGNERSLEVIRESMLAVADEWLEQHEQDHRQRASRQR